jgi:hypothetical protein
MATIPDHLLPARIVRAEVARTTWFLPVVRGTTREMVLEPDFWVHLGGKLKVDDRVEVVAQDGTFELDLRVASVDARGFWVQMRLLGEWIEPVAAGKKVAAPRPWPDAEGYRVEWGGPVHKWRIIDQAGQIVDKMLSSEAAAIDKLSEVKAEKVAA